MKRVSTLDRHLDKFGPGKDGFADENLMTGIGGTFVDASILDHLQEEIANAVEAAGIALDPLQYTQLNQVIVSRDNAMADLLCSSTWAVRATGFPAPVLGLAHDGTALWVAVGSDGVTGFIATSSNNGASWTLQTAGSGYALGFRGVHYAAGVFVAVGGTSGGGGEIQTSPDGIAWTRRATGLAADLKSVTYDGALWAAVGDNSSYAIAVTASSAVGAWTVQPAVTAAREFFDVASDGAGKMVAVGRAITLFTGVIAVSTDGGVTWDTYAPPSALIPAALHAVGYDAGVFFAAGVSGFVVRSTNPTNVPASWSNVRESGGPGIIEGLVVLDGSIICARDNSDSFTIVGRPGSLREVPFAHSSSGRCVAFGRGQALIGLESGDLLYSLVFGHRLPVI